MSIRSAVRAAPGYRFHAQAHRVKLDQNESPYDLPAEVRERALARLRDASFNRYPDLHADRLRWRIAELEAWDPGGVVVANGSNVLIQALVIAAGIGRRVLTVTPSFPIYALQAQLLGAELTEVPLAADRSLPVDALQDALGVGRGVHFVTDPMAPSGRRVGDGVVARLAEAGQERWLTVIDEAYGPFAGSDHRPLVREAANAVSLRTMSKAFGLGGVRLGYALLDPEIAAELRKTLLPFAVSSLQAAVAEAVLDDPGYVAGRVAEVRAERARLTAELSTMPGIEVAPSVTNFLLVRVPDAHATFAALLAEGVLVRRQDHLPGLEGFLRITIGAPSENDALVHALSRHLRGEAARAGVPGAAG